MWNVNLIESNTINKQVNELIETLWNVNAGLSNVNSTDLAGINRNIVECKFETLMANAINEMELIETLWNVNGYQHLYEVHRHFELIETLWNVNKKITASEAGTSLRINRNIVECKFRTQISICGPCRWN